MSWRVRLIPLALLAGGGCSVVSPPPMRLIEEPVLRPEPGAISLAVAGGGGGGIFLKEFAGAEGRLSVQATREMGFEASGGGGRVMEPQDVNGAPERLVFGRVGGVYRPTHLD